MSVSAALQRLLSIRELEEEQSRLALESALGELNRLRSTLNAMAVRDRRGRQLVSSSAQTGELPDRLAGLEEVSAAIRQSKIIAARIEHSEIVVAQLRQKFLFLRVERRQAETLIEESQAQDAVKAGRHAQQELDGWHQSRLFRAKGKTGQVTEYRGKSATARSACNGEIDPEEA